MIVAFTDAGWADYQYWVTTDRAMVKRINRLIADVQRAPFTGIGKPEALTHHLADYWSRRITDEHRLFYSAVQDEIIIIIAARHHY